MKTWCIPFLFAGGFLPQSTSLASTAAPGLPFHENDEQKEEKQRNIIETTVTIIGAGAAGISAAKILNDAGMSKEEFVIIEGRDRIGGRFHSHQNFGAVDGNTYTIENGANWIHGPLRINSSSSNTNNHTDDKDSNNNRDTNERHHNPLWEHKLRYGLKGNYTDYKNFEMTDGNTGTPISEDSISKWQTKIEDAMNYCEQKSHTHLDLLQQEQQRQQQRNTKHTTDMLPASSSLLSSIEEVEGEESSRDISVEECLQEQGYYRNNNSDNNNNSSSTVGELFKWIIFDFESAQSTATISNTWSYAMSGMYEDRDYFVTDPRGYGYWMQAIVDHEFNKDQIYLNHTVISIDASAVLSPTSKEGDDGKIVVTTEDGTTFLSDYVICTLPLGVLQHELVEFIPEFSSQRKDAIQTMFMGNYAKLYIQFDSAFWNNDDDRTDHEEILLTTTPTTTTTTTTTTSDNDDDINATSVLHFPWAINLDLPKYLPGSNILSFHVCGDTAKLIETQPLHTTLDAVVELLQIKYGNETIKRSSVLAAHVTNWTHDKYSGYGSFPDWPIGFTYPQFVEMIKPFRNRIHFAGDHTHSIFFGLGHGAIFSGRREATAILKKIKSQQQIQ